MEILFRKEFNAENELNIAKQYCSVNELRSQCSQNTLIVGRYSVLPYYRELEQDLQSIGSVLVNNYNQHRWIANFEYYEPLQ